MKFRIIYVSAGMFAAASLGLTSCKGESNAQQGGGMVPELAVLTVSESNQSLDTEFPTTLEGENDVEIRPQISGFLTKVNVEEGQHVSKGQTLFVIDQVQLQAAVDQAKASVAVAEANVNTQTTNANNNKILLDKNIISESAYQTSVDALNSAKAQLSQAKAALTSAQKNLSYSLVTAPVSGVVGTIPFREGTLVSPSSLLTVLSNNNALRANFAISESELLNLTDNGSKSIKDVIASLPEVSLLLANGTIYGQKGKIESISGVINTSTGSANAIAIFPNPDGMLRSGNTGKVLLPVNRDNVILVPQKATFEIQDLKFVYIVNDSSKLVSRNITIAPENDGKSYIVTSGLQPGETIVTEGVGISAREGIVITPKKGETAPAESAPAE